MHHAARAWRPLLALVPALALACSDAATEPGSGQLVPEPSASLSEGSLTIVSDRPFNSLASSSGDTRGAEGWNTTEHKTRSNLQIVSAGNAPRSPSKVAQVRFPRGLRGGEEPARAKREFDMKARTVTIDVWNRLSANWQGPSRAASVLFTLNINGNKRLAIEAQGEGSSKLTPAVSLWGAPDSRNELRPNLVRNAEVRRGAWQHWRVTVRLNTVGQKDGHISVALDGTTVLRYDDVAIVGSGENDWFSEFDWKPKWGGSGDRVKSDMTMQWDHVTLRASADRIAVGSNPAPTPEQPGEGAGDDSGDGSDDGSGGGSGDESGDSTPSPTVTAVSVSPSSATAKVGETFRFSAAARDSKGNVVTGADVKWTSSDPSVASVSSTGLATARSAGLALIIAVSGSVADTARFTVESSSGADTPGAPTSGYHVAPNGRSTNSGTASSPWSLEFALSGANGKIRPGDTVWIRGGTYANGGRLTVSGSASGGYITFAGYPGETAIIKRQFRTNASYVRIENLVFEGPIDGKTNQVYIYDTHHVIFTRNEIRGNDYHAGLSTLRVNNVIITHNYIHNNGRDTQHDHGIYFKTTTGGGNVIANNLLVGNAARGISIHDNSGVGVYDVIVAHNTIVNNGSTGLLVNDADRITVVNNIAINNGDARGQAQIRVLAGNNNRVMNNLTWHSSSSSRAGIENTTRSQLSGNRIGNPLFRSSSDFRLQSGSPAIGLGLSGYSYEKDFAGNERDSSPDAGAFEYR